MIDWGAQLDGYCLGLHADVRDRRARSARRRASTSSCSRPRRRRWQRCGRGRRVARSTLSPRDIIVAAGHGEHFGHGLGHGVGLEVHEGPRLSSRGDTALAPGMVVTIEPGVYVPGAVGVRIEDLVAVTDDGCEVLNGLPKQLRTV